MNEFAQRLLDKLPEDGAFAILRPENRRYLTAVCSICL